MKKLILFIAYFFCACNPNRIVSYKNDHFNADNLPVNNPESAVWDTKSAPGFKIMQVLIYDSTEYIVVSDTHGIAITFHKSLKHIK